MISKIKTPNYYPTAKNNAENLSEYFENEQYDVIVYNYVFVNQAVSSDEKMITDTAVRRQKLKWICTNGDVHMNNLVDDTMSSFGKESFENISVEQISVGELEEYEQYFDEKQYVELLGIVTDELSVIKVKLDEGAKVYFKNMVKSVQKEIEEETQNEYGYNSKRLGLVMESDSYTPSNVGTIVPIDSQDGSFYIISRASIDVQAVELIKKVLNEEDELVASLVGKIISAPKWEEDTSIDTNSLAHTKWNCKYHIVFAPKYRRKVFYEEKRLEIREILRQLCQWKGVDIIEGEVCPDHIHMLVSIPPKMSISGFMGYLKGKSAMLIYQKWGNMKLHTEIVNFGVRDIMLIPRGKTQKQ